MCWTPQTDGGAQRADGRGEGRAEQRGSEGYGFNSRLCVPVWVCVCPVACVCPGMQTVLDDHVALMLPGSDMSWTWVLLKSQYVRSFSTQVWQNSFENVSNLQGRKVNANKAEDRSLRGSHHSPWRPTMTATNVLLSQKQSRKCLLSESKLHFQSVRLWVSQHNKPERQQTTFLLCLPEDA